MSTRALTVLRAVLAVFLAAVVLLPAEAHAARKKKAPAAPPPDTSAPVITHEPLTRHAGAPPVVVRASIVDDSGVFEPTLVVRNPGGAYARVPMSAVADTPGAYEAAVPPELLAGDVEYLIEAFDTNGNGPARAGAEDAPLVVTRDAPAPPPPVPPPPAPSQQPVEEEQGSLTPVLIGAGVAVALVVIVGVAVAVGVVLYTGREPDPTKTRVVVEGPAPVAALTSVPMASTATGGAR